jgi:hypothetical protein
VRVRATKFAVDWRRRSARTASNHEDPFITDLGAVERGSIIVWHCESAEDLQRAAASLDDSIDWMIERIGHSQWIFLLLADNDEVSVFGAEGMREVLAAMSREQLARLATADDDAWKSPPLPA